MVAAIDNKELFDHPLRSAAPSHTGRQPDLTSVFDATMQSLRRRLSLFVWQGFFEPLNAISLKDDTLTIGAPSPFHRDWVEDHYQAEIRDVATTILGKPIRVIIVQGDENKAMDQKNGSPKLTLPSEPAFQFQTPQSIERENFNAPIVPLRAPQSAYSADDGGHKVETSRLNPSYTFDTFVPGPSNQMAFAACNAVAEQPGNQYSPLFLFGPVGLGKTHLLHAIGLTAQQKQADLRILYMSAEQWVNAYIHAIRERRFESFRKKFRSSCDMLLIDDIQFLAGKDASQDEFFHTFNALHQSHKQIVVTSDKYPHEIEGLEERLKTRLSWGLIADIRPPEIETRIAILHRKAETCKISLPNDVAHYLASQVTSSVRELEGALVRLSAFASLTKSTITLAHAKDYLSPVFRRGGQGQLTPEKICETVAAYYDLKVADLKGQSRQRQIALARQVAMALCRTHLTMSLPEIGRLFGGRDHTTVLSSLRKIDEMRESDIGIQSVMSRLEQTLVEGSR